MTLSTERHEMASDVQPRRARRRTIGRLAATASSAMLLVVLAMAGPASAHDSARWLYYNGSWRGHGGVTASHHYVYACDDRADGNGIYTEFNYSGGHGRVYDSNDSAPGCSYIYVSPPITSYRVCMGEYYWPEPCTSWTTA